MAEQRKKDPSFVSPAGTFIFPRLGEPDTKFKEAGEYHLKLRMSQDDAQPLLDKLEPLYQEAVEQGREKFAQLKPADRKRLKDITENPLFTPEYDEDENETGEVIFKFAMTASGVSKKTGKSWSRKPGVFDAKRKPMNGSKVWGGSIGKVSFVAFPYFVAATGAVGLSLKLEAVQVLELVSGGQKSGSAYGFEDEDGYEGSDEPAASEDGEYPEGYGEGEGDGGDF